jgi:hypothetical protein
MKYTKCEKCNKEISNSNFKKHNNVCVGEKQKKVRGIDFDPNMGYKNGTRITWNKGLTKESNNDVLKQSVALKDGFAAGRKPSGAATWSKEECSAHAKKHGFGGYRENAGRSKKFRVADSYGKEVVLQSTYELRCSKILNELNIDWIRPKSMLYGTRRYFADFYLPAYDIYLDPKNSYKAKLDEEKIRLVCEENNVKVLILLEEHLTKEYISSIV